MERGSSERLCWGVVGSCCVCGFCVRACALRWAVGSSGCVGAVARVRRFRPEVTRVGTLVARKQRVIHARKASEEKKRQQSTCSTAPPCCGGLTTDACDWMAMLLRPIRQTLTRALCSSTATPLAWKGVSMEHSALANPLVMQAAATLRAALSEVKIIKDGAGVQVGDLGAFKVGVRTIVTLPRGDSDSAAV